MGMRAGATRPGIHVPITGDSKGLEQAIRGATSSLNGFSSQVRGIAMSIAGAFSLNALAQFSAESVDLASKLEGVKEAFDRIAPEGLFEDLKKATRGTVNDLELMRQTVRANNFKIPLQQLATLFEFATLRAAQTGESVDYLVESIVLGIGRKSPLILDNLGISAVRLREKLRGVGVETASVAQIAKIMGELISEEMDAMGNVTTTTAQKIQMIKASIDNLKIAWGQLLTGGGFFQDFITGIKDTVDYWKWGLDEIKKHGGGFKEWWKFFWSSKEDEFMAGKQWMDDLKKHLFSPEDLQKQLSALEFSAKLPHTAADLADILESIRLIKAALFVGPPESFILNLGDDAKMSAEELQKLREALQKLREEQLKSLRASVKPFTFEDVKKAGAFAGGKDPFMDEATRQEWMKWGDAMLFVGKEWMTGGRIITEANKEIEISARTAFDSMTTVGDKFETTAKRMIDIGKEMQEALQAAFMAFAEMLAATISEAISGQGTLFENLLGIVGSFLKTLGSALIAAGLASEAFKSLFSNPYMAIAAGIALIALSGVVQGVLQKGLNRQGMAEGGIVPGGFPGDSYPALLTSGEMVVPPHKLNSLTGNQVVVLDTQIRGEDIYIIQRKMVSKHDRY